MIIYNYVITSKQSFKKWTDIGLVYTINIDFEFLAK